MDTLAYIAEKFGIASYDIRPPITIPNTNRIIMADTLRELGFTVGAEIGVAQGDHAELICQHNPQLTLYCVDIWKPYGGYNEYVNRIEWYYEKAKTKLSQYNCVLVRKFSEEAAKDFADGSLDFVYIDGAHDYRNVAIDLCDWSKKVRVGGIVYGHDFKRSKGDKYVNDVKDVVPSYCYAKGIRPWFILGEPGRRDGLYREGTQSWMFIRQESDKV